MNKKMKGVTKNPIKIFGFFDWFIMNINNKKKIIAQVIQLIFALTATILYIVSTQIYDFMVYHFWLGSLYGVINIMILPAIIYSVQNLFMTFVKICYCYKMKLQLKTIDLSFVFIQCRPFHIRLMINTNFLVANNLTTFYIHDLSKDIGFEEVYNKYIIPFSHLAKIALTLTVLVGTIFLKYELYYIFAEILGLALYKIVYLSIDTDHDILNPMISRNDYSYKINLYRQMLIYCRTERSNDKKVIYQYLKNTDYFWSNDYWQYNCEIITEMIFDSIIDEKEYISKEDYRLYLSSLNPPVVQGLKLNTIDVLCYFAVYNQLAGNNVAFQEIIADMRNQVIEIEFGEEPILKWFVNMYWRYVNELENGKVNLLRDFKYDCYYKFDIFSSKRIQVSQKFNSIGHKIE